MLLKLKAPAKVNLFLRVLGKRGDGYHEIATVMQAIDLCDRLTFSLAEADTLTCTDPAVPTNSSNLILRALHLFRQKSGKQLSVQIHLEKKIPMQAGLGGGSSDAAATLFACNALTGNTIPTDTLQTWSQEIGSDIPFFFSSGTAYCTGRGEVVESLSPLSLPPIAIHKPPFGLSTPAIFSAYTTSDDRCPKEALDAFQKGIFLPFNDLEMPALTVHPALKTYRDTLLIQHQSPITMTGSGSAFFSFAAGGYQPAFRSTVSWYE